MSLTFFNMRRRKAAQKDNPEPLTGVSEENTEKEPVKKVSKIKTKMK